MNPSPDQLPFTYTTDPTVAPPSGYFSLTIVGSGVSTGIPVMGHLSQPCACADAIEHPRGKNNRNNVSLLITVPLVDTLEKDSARWKKVTEAMNSETYSVPKEGLGAGSGETAPAKRSHDSFTGAEYNTLLKHSIQEEREENRYVPVRHTLVDCGKTFRDAYFKVLIKRQLRMVDALLLTHDHADAMAGLDDLRDLQRMHMDMEDKFFNPDAEKKSHEVEGHWYVDHYIPTFLSQTTFDSVKRSVEYIVNNSQALGAAPDSEEGFHQCAEEYARNFAAATEGTEAGSSFLSEALRQKIKDQGLSAPNDIGIRRSTALQFLTLPIDRIQKFYCPSLGPRIPLYSVPVEHGKNYISLGFVFGTGVGFVGDATPPPKAGSCVVYLSDISANTDVSLQFLRSLVKIDVLIVDVLHSTGRQNPVHYCMDDAIELIALLRPKVTFGMGMYCDVEHEEGRKVFQEKMLERLSREESNPEKEVLLVDLSYDGLQITLPQ